MFISSVVVFLFLLLLSTLRILSECQRGMIFTFGRFTGVKGPSIVVVVLFVQRMVRVDLRTVVHDVPSQDVISNDNFSAKSTRCFVSRGQFRRKSANR